MKVYEKLDDFMREVESSLLNTEMKFEYIDNGVMYYSGEWNGKRLYCTISETCLVDYKYKAIEKVSSLIQAYYVWLTVDGEEILNIH